MWQDAATQKLQAPKDDSLMLVWMHLGCAAEPESSHMLYIFGSCDAWIALDQTYMELWLSNFPMGKWVFDRIGHAFSHCSMDRPISAWYHTSLPDTTHRPGHLIHLAIKRTLCMSHVCFLSFAWLYMDSMDMLFRGGHGDHFYSYQAFVLLYGAYLLVLVFHARWLLQKH